jgi:hypothetical protein
VRLYRIEVAVFAIAFTVFGLVALAVAWSGGWAYELLARLSGHPEAFFVTDRGATNVDLAGLLQWHGRWAAYVLGLSPSAPTSAFFTADEYAHMTDVRAVFRGAEVAGILALFVALYRIGRARRRGDALRLVRAGTLTAAVVVVLVGAVAALAFDSLFLAFHEVFFPQGNFLFPPDSNLIRLYPEWYWQGITAGVGISFIALALIAAVAAHRALRRRATTYTRAA